MALLRDLRYGIRMIMQSPVATIVAVLALALGIGLNISSFIAVDAMVLHPFPFPRLSRIITVWEARAKFPDERDLIAPANFIDLEKQSRSFDHLAAYRSWAVILTGTNVVNGVRAASYRPVFPDSRRGSKAGANLHHERRSVRRLKVNRCQRSLLA